MGNKIYIFVGVVALVSALLLLNPTSQTQINMSPDILYITQPINNLTGIVERKEADRIIVSQTVQSNMPNAPKKVTYSVVISNKTSFVAPPNSIPFLFTTPIPDREKTITLDDIRIGSTVTASTQSDLRLLKNPVFEAINIYLAAENNIFTGTITDVQDNLVVVETSKETYFVNLNSETEISHYAAKAPGPSGQASPILAEKLALKDLKKDMQVTVYTVEDISSTKKPTALRIEPILQPK